MALARSALGRALKERQVLTSSAWRVRPASTAAFDDGKDSEVESLVTDLRQKFGRMGLVSHKKVGIRDLFRILREVRRNSDFRRVLYAMNTFYNYNVKLKHREISTRLLAAAMLCRQHSEAVDLIKLYGTWLEHPPEPRVVYSTISHFIDSGEPLIARELVAAVREDWRQPMTPALYSLAMEATRKLPAEDYDLVREGFAVMEDARNMRVRLPEPVHTRLLEDALGAFDASCTQGEELDDAARDKLTLALRVASGLASDGHLFGGGNAATMCSIAWLFWHLEALPDAARSSMVAEVPNGEAILKFQDGSWSNLTQAAIDNFDCSWGFSARLPAGFFRILEASDNQDAARLVAEAQKGFGRFYPAGASAEAEPAADAE